MIVEVVNADNMKNSKSNNCSSGYKGIRYRKDIGLFEAYIFTRTYNRQNIEGRSYHIYIGCYDTLKKAIKAREEFISSLY